MIIHWFATKLSQLSVSGGIFVGVTKSILVLVNWTITTGWTSENLDDWTVSFCDEDRARFKQINDDLLS